MKMLTNRNAKLSLVFIFTVLSFLNTNGQQYQPLPDSNASWIIQQDNGFGGFYFHKFFLSLNLDDTIINEQQYNKLFFRFDTGDPHYYGAFRNDVNGKAYFIKGGSIEEFLLRDLTKNIGDTIKNVCYEYDFDTWVLDFVVDSVEFVSAGPYSNKVMHLSTVVEDTIPYVDEEVSPLTWIEGVGCFAGGIVNSHRGYLSIKRLFCMQNNDSIFYNSSLWFYIPEDIVYEFGECEDPVGIEKTNKSELEVYPNPFSDKLTICNIPDSPKLSVCVFNTLGQKVYHKQIQTYGVITIEIDNDLESGVYLLQLTTDNGLIAAKKLIKK